MKFFRSPRFRLNSLLVAGASSLLLLGSFFHWRAFRIQVRALRSQVEALDKRIDSLPDATVSASASGSSSSVSAPDSRPIPPRILGSGRTGSWIYTDVRYGDGETMRYYLRTNATPSQVKAWVRNLAFDSREHSTVYEQ